MNKFNTFINQVGFKDDNLKEAKLTNVDVDLKGSGWTFTILLPEVLDVNQTSAFIEQIKLFFKISELKYLKIKLEFSNYNWDKYAPNYFNYIIDELSRQKGSFAILKNFDVKYENNSGYVITVDKNSKYVGKYLDECLKDLKSFGYQGELTLRVDDKIKTAKEVIKEVRVNQDSYLEARAKEVSKKTEVVAENKFSNRSKARGVSIKEVPITAYDIDKYRNEKGDANFILFGEVKKLEIRQLKNTQLLTFVLADEEDAIVVKQFLGRKNDLEFANKLKEGQFLEVSGNAQFDTFAKEVCVFARSMKVFEKTDKDGRQDTAKEKRVEFHVHTKMSNMDAITDAASYMKQAAAWGHSAIGFTDHNSLYAYPEIASAAKKYKIKPIFGAEMDFVNESKFVITSEVDEDSDVNLSELTYVIFDIETTGLSASRDQIIEIGATKLKNGSIIDRFQTFVNPEIPISSFISSLTGIKDEDVKDAPKTREALLAFFNYAKDSCLVAHNALFDMGHIKEKARIHQLDFDFKYVIDTLNFARFFYRDKLKRFNLKALAKHFNVRQEMHHRADDDAYVTAQIWQNMMMLLNSEKIYTYKAINENILLEVKYQLPMPTHVLLYAKNQVGYKNLFKIISNALTKNFSQTPRMTLESLTENREGLYVSSGCYLGEVFESALNGGEDSLKQAISFYDIIEIQPPSAYKHLYADLGEGAISIIQGIIYNIIREAKSQNKIVIASGDVHYLNQEDQMYRNMYINAPRVGKGMHDLNKYDVMPDVHLRSTNEMLEEFKFLEPDLAYEVVVKNTKTLADSFDNIKAFPDKLFSLPDDAFAESLGIVSMAEEVKRLVYEKAHQNYGAKLHSYVDARIEKELASIIGNSFAPIYYISHLLVKKSLEDGYLVGSRGSVGSSFVATLLEITEVNPLKPHYRSKDGTFVCFERQETDSFELTADQLKLQDNFINIQSGYDLPDAYSPYDNSKLLKDGHDIPFETFLGFDGDKVPDIDLNFSGEYQANAHNYVRELLGENYTFRAGTIQTVAERTAFGYVKGYLEKKQLNARAAQIERLASKIEGVQRSTGQHPGGIVVVPKNKEIFDVTPIQYPANDITSTWYTTHFDYHSFEANLLKLDILGHDDPTMIKFLMDYVKEHPSDFPFDKAQDIPLDDPRVYQLFSNTKVIGVSSDAIKSEVASYGIPEFGTPFTRQMLIDTKPNSFAGLVKISGLSHGTDVWIKNSRDLVMGETDFGKIEFNDIIACRDDIMVQLSDQGMEPKLAFDIMEFVRKGRPSKDIKTWSVFESEMIKHDVPSWYIWSAKQIKYMFPKAHAAAYVIMAMRIAWFKIYHPKLFYSAFFSKRAIQFDYEVMVSGDRAIANKVDQLNSLPNFEITATINNLQVTLGVALEFSKRGFKFLPVDINHSDATTFKIEETGLRMPFTSVDGLGASVAYDIVDKREEKAFVNLNDVKRRTKINKTVMERLENYGAFKDLNTENDVIDDGLFAL